MKIESAKYFKTPILDDVVGINATIDGSEWSVPLDPANSHYAAILEWAKEDGNEIQAAE